MTHHKEPYMEKSMNDFALDISTCLIPAEQFTFAEIEERKRADRSGPTLKFEPDWTMHWRRGQADLRAAIDHADEALFGRHESRSEEPSEIILAPGRDQDSTPVHLVEKAYKDTESYSFTRDEFRVDHPYWSSYKSSPDPMEDWALLTAHMLQCHQELMSRLLFDHDPRPALLKIVAMKPAVDTVATAIEEIEFTKKRHLFRARYLVMEETRSVEPSERAKRMESFLSDIVGIAATAEVNPRDPNNVTITAHGFPMVTVGASQSLGFSLDEDKIIAFTKDQIRKMKR